MKKVQENLLYKGETRKIAVDVKDGSMFTTSEKIEDVLGWDHVQDLIANLNQNTGSKVDFTLWFNGYDHGIKISSGKKSVFLINQCDFLAVRNLFIHQMLGEDIVKLQLIKKHNLYQAKYKVLHYSSIKSYTYEPCDFNNLQQFLEQTNAVAFAGKEPCILNFPLHDTTSKGLKEIKVFEKKKRNQRKSYRSIL